MTAPLPYTADTLPTLDRITQAIFFMGTPIAQERTKEMLERLHETARLGVQRASEEPLCLHCNKPNNSAHTGHLFVFGIGVPTPPATGGTLTAIRRFTMYRRGDLSATHNEKQVNRPEDAQFEGVVFSDGKVALRWLTALRSTSVWDSLEDAMGVHGHPEARYQSEIVWHDAALSVARPPAVSEDTRYKYDESDGDFDGWATSNKDAKR